MMENKPLKRNENIKALSRDHHWGLLFCWKIKTGLNKQVESERLKKYVDHFWNEHLKGHFRDEEVLLFNLLNDESSHKGISDHLEIATLISEMNGKEDVPAEDFRTLIALLNAHIRFEERVLFPHLERALSPATLSKIGEVLAKEHPDDYEEHYADNFWVS